MKVLQQFRFIDFIAAFTLITIFLCGSNILKGQGFEPFDSLRISGTSYLDSNFRGNNGIKWNYIKARQEGAYSITGKGMTLRDVSYGSKLYSDSIPNGISSLSLKVRKANTTSGARQFSIYVNGDSIMSSVVFGSTTADTVIHPFFVNNINCSGKFIFEVRSVGAQPFTLDDIQWKAYPDTMATLPPIVQTGNAEWHTTDTCRLLGNILSVGSSQVIEKGFLLEPSSDIDFNTSTKIVSNAQVNPFRINFDDFQRNTMYYYQAYAINMTDTAYGQVLSFFVPELIISDTTIETFDLLQTSSTAYSKGMFIGVKGVKWNYINARTNVSEQSIDGKGLIFRYSAESLDTNSRIFSDSIAGGIANFSVKLRKAYSTTGVRQVALYINNDSIAASPKFGNFTGESDTVYTFSVNGINKAGVFSMEIRHITGNLSNRQLTIDDISWTKYSALSVQTLAALGFEVGGFIDDSGSSAIFEKGILIGQTHNLTLETSEKVTSTELQNPFHINISEQFNNCECDTLYYRAFAVTMNDTAYGSVKNIAQLDIKEILKENLLPAIIYPNPSNGIFWIDIKGDRKCMAKIYNAKGQTVIERSFVSKGKFQVLLKQKGTYFVRIEDSKTKEYTLKKIIVY